jgi:hypothetical protein
LRWRRAAFAFARRRRIAAAESRAEPPAANWSSPTGATLRASLTITKAIPASSTMAAPSARMMTVLELEVDSVEGVLAVVWVGVVSCPPPVSSPSAFPPRTADLAAGAPRPASARARTTHSRHSDVAR